MPYYPEDYPIADLPGDNPSPGFVWIDRSPLGWVEKRSDGKVSPLMSQIESTRDPTIADLDAVWSEWWVYAWDMPNLKAVVSVWRRSPISNDLFPPLNPVGQVSIDLTPTTLANGNKKLDLPQGVTFEYTVSRASGVINQLSFAAGAFSGVSSSYLDAAKTPLSTGARAHAFTATQTGAGLGITVAAPATATFIRYEFQYVAGGKLTYDYAI